MEIYRVGGSVRDELLGLRFHDADWVVVGATPDQMTDLGYRPVGKDFPVFLHPESHEEYALARTERKTGPGYKGFDVHFSPDVTLEEDLLRRDLTINAMARADDGTLIDPYNGQQDLTARLFRHVSDAFTEDPVRILRVARFAARFADFALAPETLALMRQMAAAGEVDALVAERVWQELARGLMEQVPARMMAVLADADALSRLIPGLQDLDHLQAALNRTAQATLGLPARFGVLALACDNTGGNGLKLAAALRAPNECRDVAKLLIQEKARLFADRSLADTARSADPEILLNWIERLDGLRRPERLPVLMAAASAWSPGTTELLATRLSQSLQAVQTIDAGAIAKPLAPQGPAAIAAGLRTARLLAISDSFKAKT